MGWCRHRLQRPCRNGRGRLRLKRQSPGLCRCVVVVVLAVGLMWFGWTRRGQGDRGGRLLSTFGALSPSVSTLVLAVYIDLGWSLVTLVSSESAKVCVRAREMRGTSARIYSTVAAVLICPSSTYTPRTPRTHACSSEGVFAIAFCVCFVCFQTIVFFQKMGAASFRRSVPWQSEPGNQIKAA